MNNPTGMKVVACIHPDTLSMLQSDSRSARVACERWTEVREMDGYVPLVTLADAEAAIPQWRPIETAPRDGRQLILLLTPSNWPQIAWSNTWWTAGFSVECKPTHWAPIPQPVDAALSKLGEKGNG